MKYALLSLSLVFACVHAPTLEETSGGPRLANIRTSADFAKAVRKFAKAKRRGTIDSLEVGEDHLVARGFKDGPFAALEWWKDQDGDLTYAFLWLRDGETVGVQPGELDAVFTAPDGELRRLYSAGTLWEWHLAKEGRIVGYVYMKRIDYREPRRLLSLDWAVDRARQTDDPYAALLSYGFEGIARSDPRLKLLDVPKSTEEVRPEQGVGTFASASAPGHVWSVAGAAGTKVGLAVQAWPGRVRWAVYERGTGRFLTAPDYTGAVSFELPAAGAEVRIDPVGVGDEKIKYTIDTDHTSGVTLASTDGQITPPLHLMGTRQAVGPDEKGTAEFTRKNDDYRHPQFDAPMHEWTVSGPPGRSRKIQIAASSSVLVIAPGLGQPEAGQAVEFWLDYDTSGQATFHVLPARRDLGLTYTVDASGEYTIRGVGSSGGSAAASAASPADAWASTQAALERRLAAIDRELTLAREGAAPQIDVVGKKETDHGDFVYFKEKQGGAYQDHWAARKLELEKERAQVLAEIAAHAAKRP